MASPISFSERWEKSLLQSNKEDAFRFLETIFSVAATRWPDDLLQRRPQIMEKLYAPVCDHHNLQTEDSILQSGFSFTREAEQKEAVLGKKRCIIRLKIPSLHDDQAKSVASDKKRQKESMIKKETAAAAAVLATLPKDSSFQSGSEQKEANLGKKKCIIRLKIPSLPADQAKSFASDKKPQKELMIKKETEKKTDTAAAAAAAVVAPLPKEEDRLEASIRKVNDRYRHAQINKRKIQMVEFQNKTKIPSNKRARETIPCSNKKRKTIRAPETLTSWIDKQTRRKVLW